MTVESLNEGVAAWRRAVSCSASEGGAVPLHVVVGVTPGVDFCGGGAGAAGPRRAGGGGKGAKLHFGGGRRAAAAGKRGAGAGAGGGALAPLEQQWAALMKKARAELAKIV